MRRNAQNDVNNEKYQRAKIQYAPNHRHSAQARMTVEYGPIDCLIPLGRISIRILLNLSMSSSSIYPTKYRAIVRRPTGLAINLSRNGSSGSSKVPSVR